MVVFDIFGFNSQLYILAVVDMHFLPNCLHPSCLSLTYKIAALLEVDQNHFFTVCVCVHFIRYWGSSHR